jgi:hypothetical protein
MRGGDVAVIAASFTSLIEFSITLTAKERAQPKHMREMPRKSWFVQIYPVGGKPKAPMVFTDFDKLCAFIDEFRKAGSYGAVTVYSTESATNNEDVDIDELGVTGRSGDDEC